MDAIIATVVGTLVLSLVLGLVVVTAVAALTIPARRRNCQFAIAPRAKESTPEKETKK